MPRFDFGTGNQFSNYDNISRIAAGQAPQQLPQQQQQQSQIQSPQFPMREMTGGERIFAGLADIGNALSDSQGFSNYYENNGRLASLLTPEGFARFALNLPAGMAGALPTGVANLYAAGTGSDVVYGSDLANNMIREEKLDAGQRLASAITGGIDTFGLAVGGSGSAINEIGRAVKAGRGIEAAAKTGSGARALNLTGSSFANRGVMTPGQAFAFDVAEEAGEEAVQSLSEDVIQKQLDDGSLGRAFEGAVMGGLGGGMMSGGALAMRNLTNSDIDKAATPPNNKYESGLDAFSLGDELVSVNNRDGFHNYTANAAESKLKEETEEYTNKQPGSYTLRFVSSGKYDGFAVAGVGISDVRDILAKQDRAEAFAKWLDNGTGTFNVQKLFNLARRYDDNQFADELNRVLASNFKSTGGHARIGLKRDPASDQGFVTAYIVGFNAGRGLDMSGTLAKSVGGDYDSDMGSIFFDLESLSVQPNAWAYDTMLRNESIVGEGVNKQQHDAYTTKYEFTFSPLEYSEDAIANSELKNRIYGFLANAQVELGGVADRKFGNEVTDIIWKAYKQSPSDETVEDTRDVAIAKALTEVRKKFDDRFPQSGGYAGHLAIEQIFKACTKSPKATVHETADYLKTEANKARDFQETEGAAPTYIPNAGETDSYGTAVKVTEGGMPEVHTSFNRDQTYRDYADQIYQWGKRKGEGSLSAWAEQNGINTMTSAYGEAILLGCRQVHAGEDPSDAVISMISRLIERQYEEEIKKLPSTPMKISDRMDIFCKVYCEWAAVKNDVMKTLSGDVYVPNINAAQWDTSLSYSDKKTRQKAVREFLRIFGHAGIRTILGNNPAFGESDNYIIARQTLVRSIRYMAEQNIEPFGFNTAEDSGVDEFFKIAISAIKSEGSIAENYAIRLFEKFDVEQMLQRLKDNDGVIPETDLDAWLAYTEAVEFVMGPGHAWDVGFVDPQNWLNTTILSGLLTSKDAYTRLNAVVQMNFRAKFGKFIAFKRDNPGQVFNAKLEDELTQLANLDVVHAEIVDELRKDPNARSGVLERLMDKNTSFEQKQKWLNDAFANSDGMVENSLFLISRRNGRASDELASMESVLTQMRQARASYSKFRKANMDAAYTELGNLKEARQDGRFTDAELKAAWTDMTVLASSEISIEPLLEMMADTANITNKQPEKGTTTSPAGHYYVNADNSKSGYQTSFITDQFDYPLGTTTEDVILNNPKLILRFLSSPSFQMDICLNDGRTCHLNRDAIWKSVCGSNYDANIGPTADNIMQLLEFNPALITYLGGLGTSSRDSIGGPKDTVARTGRFLDVVIGYEDRRGAGTLQKQYKAQIHLARVKNALFSDMRFPGIVYACLSPETQAKVAQGLKPDRKEVEKVIDRIVKGWYAMRIKSSISGNTQATARLIENDSVNNPFRKSVFGKIFRRLDSFATILDNAAARSVADRMGAFEDAISSNVEDLAVTNFYLDDIEKFYPNIDERARASINGLRASNDVAAFSGYANALDDYHKIYVFHIALARQLGLEVAGSIETSYISKAEATLNALLQDPNSGFVLPANFATAREFARQMYQDLYGDSVISSLVPDYGSLLFDSNLTNDEKKANLEAIIDEIADETNNPLLKEEGEKTPRAELLSEFGKLPANAQVQDARKFLFLLHSYRVMDAVYDIQDYAEGIPNPAIMRDYAEYQDWFDSLLSDPTFVELFADNEVIKEASYRSAIFDGKDLEDALGSFPVPNYSDRRTASLARRLSEVTASGRVISEVGKNGMMHNELAGIDAVPARPLGQVLQNVVKWGEIESGLDSEALLQINRMYVRRVSNGVPVGEPVTIESVRDGSCGFTLSDNDEVERFDDPRINPHGIFLGPALAPVMGRYAQNYKTAAGGLNRMQMAAIEDLVLKVRKKFGAKGDFALLRNRYHGSIYDSAIDQCRLTDEASARKSYVEFIDKCTDLVYGNSIYKADLEEIGIGRKEIMQIVQMMVVGVDVTVNGQHQTIDVMKFFDGSFASDVTSLGVTEGKFIILPLTAVAKKVERAVMVEDPGVGNNAYETAAYNAMTNWNDYKYNTVDPKEILSKITPLGWSHDAIRGARDSSALQKLWLAIDPSSIVSKKTQALMISRNEWVGLKPVPARDGRVLEGIEKDICNARDIVSEHFMRRGAYASSNLTEEAPGSKIPICRVFGSDVSFGQDEKRIHKDLETALRDLSQENNVYHNQGDSVLLLSNSRDDIEQAVAYAISTQSDLIVPKSIWGSRSRTGFVPTALEVRSADGEMINVPAWRIRYNKVSMSPKALFGGAQARLQEVVPEDYFATILLDKHGKFPGIGDSVTRMLRSVAQRFIVNGESGVEQIDLEQFIQDENSSYYLEKLTENEVAALAGLNKNSADGFALFKKSFAQLSNDKSGTHLTDYEPDLRELVINCAKNMQKNQDLPAVPLAKMQGRQFATILALRDGGGNVVRYIPIMIPAKIGTLQSGFVMYDGGSTITISYSEKLDLAGESGSSWWAKSDITDVAAAKSMVSFVDSFGRGNCSGFDATHNYNTLSGRMKGREVETLYTNLSRQMLISHAHLLLQTREDVDQNGKHKLELASWFQDLVNARIAQHPDYLQNTLDGDAWNASLWSDIISGAYIPPTFNGNNETFSRIVRQARDAGIPLMTLFGAANWSLKEDGTVQFGRECPNPDLYLAFDGCWFGDIIDFYSCVGSDINLIQPQWQNSGDAKNSGYMFDNLGRKGVVINDEWSYEYVLISPFLYMGHSASDETPGNEASLGVQQHLNQLSMYGADNRMAEFAIHFARARNMLGTSSEIGILGDWAKQVGDDNLYFDDELYYSWQERQAVRKLKGIAKDDCGYQRRILLNHGEEEIEYGKNDDGVSDAVESLGETIGWNDIPLWVVHYLVNHKDGTTKGDGQNDSIKAGTFVRLIGEIENDYKRSGKKTLIMQDPGRNEHSRIAAAVLHPVIVDLICNKTGMDKTAYLTAMWEQEEIGIQRLNKLTAPKDKSRANELRRYFAALRLQYGDPNHKWGTGYDYIFGVIPAAEVAESDSGWAKILQNAGYDAESFRAMCDMGRRIMSEVSAKFDEHQARKLLSDDRCLNGPTPWAGEYQTKDIVTKTAKNIVSLSRLAAVANPGVLVGNLAGRFTAQTSMEIMLDIGAEYGIGPLAFANEHRLSDEFYGQITGDEALNVTWNAIRHMSLIGEDVSALANATSPQELIENIKKKDAEYGAFNKNLTNMFDFANGGNLLTKQQTRIFFKRLIQFMSAEPALQFYFETLPGDDMSYIEKTIRENPSRFLLDCLSAGGHPELYVCAMQAMNSALTGDMAQRHFLASFLHHLAQQTTVGDFLFSTIVCKFPKYQFNLVGKYVQWFAPASTTYVLLTGAAKALDEKLYEKYHDQGYVRYNFDLDQRFVNLREAMAYDMTHMGALPLMCILLSIGNAIEPPDDENKWGDPNEWLIGGYRIGESWWLTDMLGAFMPTILYTKSFMLGKPTSSLLINGTMAACCGNPFLRAADAANILVDWDDGALMDYQHTAELYADARGGAPGFLDWVQANTAAGMANWVTSLVTPSIAKEIYRNSQPYEKSYKRVYKTTATGRLSEQGEKGYTEATDYQDAMLRKACRNNPILAWALDLLHPDAPTGYLLGEMPNVIYWDEAQRASAEKWSIEGLDENSASALMWSLYLYFDNTSVEDMQKSGFYLDKETLSAFCSYLWDSYYKIEDDWKAMQARGELDYKYLGDGDWDTGSQIYAEMYRNKEARKKDLSNLYYQKIRNSYLRNGMQQYLRYSTSYRTDSEGNLYATGMRRQGALPFVSAPGTSTNPEGTAGYENDFVSISAVTGKPMSQRALIPVPGESLNLPAFEEFSKNGDGNGYSGRWTKYANVDGDRTTSTPATSPGTANGTPKITSYTTRPSGGSGGSGGGGGSRRSSGSPSTYVPGISSRNYTPNTPNAATARASRAYDAQFDYLRPNVETKGSRDAYKRGDM